MAWPRQRLCGALYACALRGRHIIVGATSFSLSVGACWRAPPTMLGLNYTPAPTQARRPALFTPAARPDAAAANGGPVPARQPYALAASDMHLAGPSAVEEEEEAPSAGMMHAFAQALEQWTATVDDPTKVASHMPLLAAYEKICDREIEALEARLQQPSNSATRASTLAGEAALLRGERSSWRLLRLLYSDFDARQQEPPELPRPPEDWGRDLRALGSTQRDDQAEPGDELRDADDGSDEPI